MSQPTPTSSGLPFRAADFETLCDGLDYASRGSCGINFYDGRGSLGEALSYRDLREQALVLARKMIAAGLRAGERAAIVASTDGDFVRAFTACQYAGLVPAPMPMPAAFGGRQPYVELIQRMVRLADASAVIIPESLREWLAEAVAEATVKFIGTVAELSALAESNVDLPPPDPDALAYLQFSSGSTRFPVGVAVTHRALLSNTAAIVRHGLNVQAGDRCVSWLPMYHDMGLVGFLLTPIVAQMSLDLVPTSEFARRPLLWPTLISRNGGSLSFSPSFGYDLCRRRAQTARVADLDLRTWRGAGIGGDMIRPGVLAGFAEAFAPYGFRHTAFIPSYGMAEATLAISFAPLDNGVESEEIDVDRLEREGIAVVAEPGVARSREFVKCGKVLSGHQLEVRDESGQVVPEGRVGRIHVRGPSIMREYFARPSETAEAIGDDGWLNTGDLGYLRDGAVVITGRAKDLIIVNGRNVWPQDLEWSIEHEVEGVRPGDIAAFSVDADGGETVVILAQCRSADAAVREQLRAAIHGVLLARHGLEGIVVLVPNNSLPHTSSGKLSRSRARQMYLAGAWATAPAVGAA